MVELGPLTPLNADFRAPGLRKPAAIKCYSYIQVRHGLFIRERYRNYWTTVYEDHAGRRRASTTRDLGRIPVGCDAVEPRTLSRMPKSILISVGMVLCCVLICLAVPLGLAALPLDLFGGIWIYPRIIDLIQRQRFEQEMINEDYDLPPLLSEEELDQRLTALAEPGEEQAHEDPTPIPLPQLLRGRAWLHWEDRKKRYTAERRFRIGDVDMAVSLESQLGKARESLQFLRERNPGHIDRKAMTSTLETAIADLETRLDKMAIPHPGLRRLTDEKGRPQLSRGFEPETDCQNGHVGLHYAGEFVVGTDRERRVPRACRWCESTWTELAR